MIGLLQEEKRFLKTILPIFLCAFFCVPMNGIADDANVRGPLISNVISEKGILSLNSHSFNAKKPSGFSINGIDERISRGLTVVHFNSTENFEYKSFDTHGSEEETLKFISCLELLQKNRSTYVILAHDSASKSLAMHSAILSKMGFKSLSMLKSRQAYVMNNFSGSIKEVVHDMSISIALEVPQNLASKAAIFPKTKYDFEPRNDRYIAHAGGEIHGVPSTNSVQALDANYKKGFRLFELDIIETSDGEYVAAHDWRMWARFTDYSGDLPVSKEAFLKRKIYGKYDTMDMDGINKWFGAHPDAILITDKVSDPIRFAKQFNYKDRLIMELFSVMAIEEAAKHGISPMISQTPLNKLKGDKIAYLKANNVKHAAISRRIIRNNIGLLKKLREHDIKVYVYNVNFDPGKDERYVLKNEIGLVYGMYADKWVFDREEVNRLTK
ncbi:MAG: interleukin-like EMT inducer domain-containing protein [Flavobacteriaceae bacterium]